MTDKKLPMDARKKIAQHEIYATGTTGKVLEEEIGIPINKLQSGALGGDQQIGAKFQWDKSILYCFSGTNWSRIPMILT